LKVKNSLTLKTILLASGLGERLRPFTDVLPKCLMPIDGVPLLEYWLASMHKLDIHDVLVNVHFRSADVINFLSRPRFSQWVTYTEEKNLLGTAGTIRANLDFLRNSSCFLAHADNWCCCNFQSFINFHRFDRPRNTSITMMTFTSDDPRSCGIVETDKNGIVICFHEKVRRPPSNKANAAVYLIEPEVIEWIEENENVKDFSTEVIPSFIGNIATWHNHSIHRDIGTIDSLLRAQHDIKPSLPWSDKDKWQKSFDCHDIHRMISETQYLLT
jgi:mannose-1-phosphate guanylyltransferase